MTYFSPGQKQALYTEDFLRQQSAHDTGAWLTGLLAGARGRGVGALDAVLSADVGSYLPYDLLVKMDIATMAHSLEARSPLLDQEVMEFAAGLQASYKIRGTTLKYLLKTLARTLLPADTLDRRKMGFAMPIGAWLRGELRPLIDDVLLSPRASARGYFRPDRLRRLVDEHAPGTQDHSARLWALLWLELWHREFLD
jgi:asparagine synthase (glutamine-hydrolysing)